MPLLHKAMNLILCACSCSIAKSLGALTVTAKALQYYRERPIISEVVTDRDVVAACLQFAGMWPSLIKYQLIPHNILYRRPG